METVTFFPLNSLSLIDIVGKDAGVIVHNVTTNEVKSLAVSTGCETFLTDVRGKTIGHGWIFRINDPQAGDETNNDATIRLRFVGAPGQSDPIHQHIDKYTIREDATPEKRDPDFQWWAVSARSMGCLLDQLTRAGATVGDPNAESESPSVGCQYWQVNLDGIEIEVYQTDFLGPQSGLVSVPTAQVGSWRDWMASQVGTEDEKPFCFDLHRVAAGFPWHGIDLDASNLPQELDRDASAISFTKGCYLGQETVARLDALGQVQRKLVVWAISGEIPSAGDTLEVDGKAVGRLTTIVPIACDDDSNPLEWVTAESDGAESFAAGNARFDALPEGTTAVALGYARRSHFEPGAKAVGKTGQADSEFVGIVIQ